MENTLFRKKTSSKKPSSERDPDIALFHPNAVLLHDKLPTEFNPLFFPLRTKEEKHLEVQKVF